MKKICLFLLTFSIVFNLTSCKEKTNNKIETGKVNIGDTGGLELPLTKNNETITWFVSSTYENLNDSYVIQKIRELTGINLQLIVHSPSTVEEKINVLLASKNLPDIIGSGITTEKATVLAMQGAFAAVSDNLDILPNFRKTFVENKENNWIFKSYSAPDGKLYGFFGYDWNRDVNHGMLYRKDIFDKHGLKMWNSPNEFYIALKKLKGIYPDSVPFTSKNADSIFTKLSTSWGLNANNPYYNEDLKEWKYSDTDPKYKEMLDYLKKLYDEKLLDPEFLTLTQSAWTSKMTQADKAFTTWDWIGRLDMFYDQTRDTIPEYDLRYANPIGPKQTIIAPNQLCWARFVSNTKNSKLALKLLDFILSPAGAELLSMGIKGETYELGENGMAKYLEFEKLPSSNELAEKYGMFTEGMYLKFDRRSSYFNFTQKENEAQDFAKNKNNLEPMDPTLAFTTEEAKLNMEVLPSLVTASKEFTTRYVLGIETGDAAWENWCNRAKQLGSDSLIERYNVAQKRYDN